MESIIQETESKNASTMQEARRQIHADAELHFPNHLKPSLPSQAHAFEKAKAEYIRKRICDAAIAALKKQDNPPESGRCGRDVDSQPVPSGPDADAMRTTSGPVRTDADDADENPIPLELRGVMDFMRKYQADKADLVIAALDLRSPLDQLAPEKQRLLFDAITEFGAAAVHRVVTLPEPQGWGLDIGETSLKRFKSRYAKRTLAQKRHDSTLAINELLADAESGDERYSQAAERLLKIRLLETINDPASETSQIRDLYQTLNRLRQTALAEKRLELAERKSTQPSAASKILQTTGRN